MALFTFQWAVGTLVYLNPCCPGWIRAKLMNAHIACGTISMFL